MSFSRFRPKTFRFPIMVSNPHVGLDVHPLRAELGRLPMSVYLRDADYEIHRMWEPVCRDMDIAWIGAKFHRYNLDLNRRPELNDDFVLGHPTKGKGEKKGLFWKESTLGEDIHFRPLSETTALRLIEEIWRPYYSFIEETLEAMRLQFGYALLIDGHSMPSRGEKNHSDSGAERADIVPGTLDGKSCQTSIRAIIEDGCRTHGLSCAFDNPYKGGNITQHFCRPEKKIQTLQIETNRKIYMNEETKEILPKAFEKLNFVAKDWIQKINAELGN